MVVIIRRICLRNTSFLSLPAIISLTLVTLMFDSVMILLGEIRFLQLLRV